MEKVLQFSSGFHET